MSISGHFSVGRVYGSVCSLGVPFHKKDLEGIPHYCALDQFKVALEMSGSLWLVKTPDSGGVCRS